MSTRGQLAAAWASMVSDMGEHPELADHAAIQLGCMMLVGGHLSTAHDMRKFIEGFN